MAEGGNTAAAVPLLGAGNTGGIIAMLGGTASFTGNDTLVKLLGANLPPGEIMCLRGAVAAALLTAIAYSYGALQVPSSLWLRPAFGWRLVGELGSTMTFVIALMHLQFADSSGIQQFQPLAVTASAAIFLREPVGWRRWLAAFVGLVGVLLIVKPGTGAFNPYALLAACCVLFVGLRDLCTRAVPAGVPALLLALASALTVMFGALLLSPFESWQVPQPGEIAMLSIAAIFVVGGYVLVTLSVRIGDLSVVSPFRYAGVIFAVLIQLAVWRVAPDAVALIGMVIVVGAGLYTFHREHIRRLGHL